MEEDETMPMPEEERTRVLEYCVRHIEAADWFRTQITFVSDAKLADELNLAFYSARYVEKLGEALAVSGDQRHPHLKFQIVQYASIYEAVINHLLYSRYIDHAEVRKIGAEREYVKICDMPKAVVDKDGEHLTICKKKIVNRDPIQIRFESKLKAAEAIGLITSDLKTEILALYKTRNAVHLEAAVRNSVTYEAKQSGVAYRRIRPFLEGIRDQIAREDAATIEAASTD